jgi:hypothetical protein
MTAPASATHLIFLGTYTKNGSRGIYTVHLDADTGTLTAPALVAESPDPGWLTLSPNKKFLYAIHPSAALATGYAVDTSGPAATLTPLAAPASTPPSPPNRPHTSPSTPPAAPSSLPTTAKATSPPSRSTATARSARLRKSSTPVAAPTPSAKKARTPTPSPSRRTTAT